MKDYDEGRLQHTGVTRSFTIAGESFVVKPVMGAESISELADIETSVVTDRIYQRLTGIVRRTIVAADRERWDELLARDLDIPIELKTLMEIAEDLVADGVGRPSQPLSPSTNGGESTQTQSTGGSGSTEAAASTGSTSEHS